MAIFTLKEAIKRNNTTPEEVKSLGVIEKQEEKPGYVSRVFSTAKTAVKEAVKTTERGAELMEQGKPVQGAIMSGLGAAGSAVRLGFSPITAALEPYITSVIKSSGITENKKVQETLTNLNSWVENHPDAAENLKNIFDIGTAVIGTKGATEIGGKLKTSISKVVGEIPPGAGGGGSGILGTMGRTVESIKPIASAAKESAELVTGGIARIPGRIATNLAEKQAFESTIKSLPTKIAQTAARDGVDILDLKTIYNIPKEIKPIAQRLVDNVVKFAKKETDIDPIEMVGKPIVAKMKELESLRGKIGQKLGVVADSLGSVTEKEVFDPVFNSLKKVSGLNGLKLDEKGLLDFTDTVLSTSGTASDRNAIQSIFNDAVKSGTGKQKHLLRQELFEILGGKKKANLLLTDTQEKAYQAIRSGLSTVLESKNSTYKSLSNEYRKILQPLSGMRKVMRVIPDATEDILDMSAGLLARRLTSTSISQGQIRSLLSAMDKATAKAGNILSTTENIQKLYNVLNKYYDLAPSTGFQGQVKAGIEGTTGFSDMVIKGVKGLAGETPAVRQKAIEEAIKEALR
jgi:hypothetical protein